MYKNLIVILLFCCFFLNMTAQEFPSKEAKWGLVSSYWPDGGSQGSKEYFEGDSLVQVWNGKISKSIFKTRYEYFKLYVDFNEGSGEILLYDFNLKKGDTFYIPFDFTHYNDIAIVIEDTFLYFAGKYRKRITLSYEHPYGNELVWIEGIGDINNKFYYLENISTTDASTRLVCFSDESGSYKVEYLDVDCDTIDRYYYNFIDVSSASKSISR